MSVMNNALSGAGTGAAIGSVVPGVGTAIGGLAGGLIGGIGTALLGRQDQQTKIQKQQGELVDQLLASLGGQGPYSNLFNVDENAFQRSFVDPMKQKFQSQIAPQIQQSYIASGQQRGTGLDDTLTRAGVDMDQMLNQYYYQAQQDAMNRQQNTMGNILGLGAGAPTTPTLGQTAMQGAAGYLSSDAFGTNLESLLKAVGQPRKGFEKSPAEATPGVIS